eukprot:755024_1
MAGNLSRGVLDSCWRSSQSTILCIRILLSMEKYCFKSVLKKFGLNEFRPLQEKAISTVLNKEDVLLLLPTGGGKSLCYQLPAVVVKGVVIVLSPLIALIENQVAMLKSRKIAVEMLSSSVKKSERSRIFTELRSKCPKIDLLYTTPETITSESFAGVLESLHKHGNLAFVAIDECHCISSWGHDFRPAFRRLHFLKERFPKVPLIALTATATDRVRNDVISALKMKKPKVIVGDFDRPNIQYAVRFKESLKQSLWLDVAEFILLNYPDTTGIIYCHSRKDTQAASSVLSEVGISVGVYHAGIKASARTYVQQCWQSGKVRVMCATVAFGMGIDKADVRFVVHACLPKSVDEYYQESGRAGRDGRPSSALLYYSQRDRKKREFFLGKDWRSKKSKGRKKIVSQHAAELLKSMVKYAEHPSCRRKHILDYFSNPQTDNSNQRCCDFCDNPVQVRDSTAKALVARSRSSGGYLGTVKGATVNQKKGGGGFGGGFSGGFKSAKELMETFEYSSDEWESDHDEPSLSYNESKMLDRISSIDSSQTSIVDFLGSCASVERAQSGEREKKSDKLKRKREKQEKMSELKAKNCPCEGSPKTLDNGIQTKVFSSSRVFGLSKLEKTIKSNRDACKSSSSFSNSDTINFAETLEHNVARKNLTVISYNSAMRDLLGEIRSKTVTKRIYKIEDKISVNSQSSNGSSYPDVASSSSKSSEPVTSSKSQNSKNEIADNSSAKRRRVEPRRRPIMSPSFSRASNGAFAPYWKSK